ncbi:G-protein-coupled receptor family 3 protein 5 [Pelomyxa schiedti]|nr:G-protein-coupled receptor family 3 protein 5 [Pelomyxa schiedti]
MSKEGVLIDFDTKPTATASAAPLTAAETTTAPTPKPPASAATSEGLLIDTTTSPGANATGHREAEPTTTPPLALSGALGESGSGLWGVLDPDAEGSSRGESSPLLGAHPDWVEAAVAATETATTAATTSTTVSTTTASSSASSTAEAPATTGTDGATPPSSTATATTSTTTVSASGGGGEPVALDKSCFAVTKSTPASPPSASISPFGLPSFTLKPADFFAKYLLDKPDYYAIVDILQLESKFFADISRFDVGISLLVLSLCYQKYQPQIGSPIEDVSFLKDALMGMKYANGTYGWQLLTGIMGDNKVSGILSAIPKEGDALSLKALSEHTGIPPEAVLHTQWTSTLFNPGHYLAVDVARRTIVVAFRGTFHVKDAITDLNATPMEFTFDEVVDGVKQSSVTGTVHRGMLMCAQQKFPILEPFILDAHAKYPDFRILVVGHSLGAGVAQFFTLLLLKVYPQLPVLCYAYGPAAVFSRELAESPQLQARICCFCHKDDIIPRLSLGSLEALKTTLRELITKGGSTTHLLTMLTSQALPFASMRAKLPQITYHKGTEEFGKDTMVPAGKVYLMLDRERNGKPSVRKAGGLTYTMWKITQSEMSLLVISQSMFMNHMPDKYESVMAACLAACAPPPPTLSHTSAAKPPTDSSHASGH